MPLVRTPECRDAEGGCRREADWSTVSLAWMSVGEGATPSTHPALESVPTASEEWGPRFFHFSLFTFYFLLLSLTGPA